jgi:hypothetical protein
MALQRIRLSQIKAQDPGLNSFDEQVTGMGIPYYQIVTATENQTEIVLTKPYQIGVGQLNVFLNGMRVTPTSTPLLSDGIYREKTNTKIEFINALSADDIVEIRMEGKGQGIAMVVDHYHSYQEEPIGVINSINKTFSLSKNPKEGSESIYLNGRLMRRGQGNDYTISGNIINFNDAPESNSVIIVNYDSLYLG